MYIFYLCPLSASDVIFQNQDVDECLTSIGKSCDKILRETCSYKGNVIHSTPDGSTPDINNCSQLCISYEGDDCMYWKFDENKKQCTLYDNKASDCYFVSGPNLPIIETCGG